MDPLTLVLISSFGGAGITVVAGFIGASIQARREHQRWLREKRLEAFVRALVLVREVDQWKIATESLTTELATAIAEDRQPNIATDQLRALASKASAAIERLQESYVPMRLLGPPNVNEAISAYLDANIYGDKTASQRAELDLVAAMQEAIGVVSAKWC